MMLVPTELRPSKIHGMGVYLLAPVKKNDVVWRFDSRIDRAMSEADIASLPELAQSFVRRYSCWNKELGLWAWHGDNGRFINHSDTPNTHSTKKAFGDDVASINLEAGVELTSDYRSICDYTLASGTL